MSRRLRKIHDKFSFGLRMHIGRATAAQSPAVPQPRMAMPPTQV
ncbi:MAG TPA: hypothetical protein VG759_11865 [Candidatus Angelobacter sp.]|nr:hypothetical protein [Candidatus Angelobacter sp.]